ncbi:MAG TPA: GntP family permease [Candidatus Caccovicinus merdipullorum]|uniref:GntP family permease n=1 Tax=Candidatus Caccovicinus merdipullorum TaxID=2840724 RepID=A0A9D1GIU8_9FIRM|nr:GntP family permease [Candidatus Caccovicinus merdipullorum]
MTQETQMLLGLFLGIAIMIILVMKTKTHTFIALLLAALITGLIGRMSPTDAINAIQDGFGNTLKSTGIIIGLGVMMGGILEKTGAAERLAYTFIKTIGKGKEEWALGITGWLVSIPVFADSAIVIFAPLCKAMSRVTGKSVIGLALALACGLQCTHVMVPPTPGPLTAAGMFGVDVGQMILAGAAMSIPIFIAAICYAQWIGKRIYQIPQEDGTFERKEYKKEYIKSMEQLEEIMNAKDLPALLPSLAPIVVPLILILCNTVADFAGMSEGFAYDIISLVGSPIVALAIGTTLAVYGLGGRLEKSKVMKIMDESIKDTGMIMLITGAGGSLGNVIKVSGIGDVLGAAVVALPIPAILIPLIIGALMRIALGSATVAITTAASLTAPLAATLGINPILLAQSSCIGAIAFSYFNDSGFWVFNGMFGLSELKDQVRCKTAVSLVMTGVGIVELLILSMIF